MTKLRCNAKYRPILVDITPDDVIFVERIKPNKKRKYDKCYLCKYHIQYNQYVVILRSRDNLAHKYPVHNSCWKRIKLRYGDEKT